MSNFRYPSFTIVLFVFLLVGLGGCRQDGASTDPTDSVLELQDSWERSGNEAIIRIPSEPRSLNPAFALDSYSLFSLRQVMQYLLFLDPETGQLSPQLALDFPTSTPIEDGPFAGGTAYTFEIHPEATWDNGTPVTGNDYAFSIKAILNPKVPAARLRPYLDPIGEVEVDSENPRKFTVLTDEKYILTEETISGTVPVLPAYLYDPNGLMEAYKISELSDPANADRFESDTKLAEFAESFSSEFHNREPEGVSGSGPYRLASWTSGQELIFAKKENYWGDKVQNANKLLKAYPDSISFKITRDMTAAATLIKNEEVDAALVLDSKDFLELQENEEVMKDYRFLSPATLTTYLLYLNNQSPKLADAKVRRALAHLVDVNEVIETVFYGLAAPVVGPIHPSKPYYHKALEAINLNIEKASTLLAEAGWEDSDEDGILDKEIDGERVPLKLRYIVNNFPASEQIALLFQENARQAGVELEITAKERAAWVQTVSVREYDIASGGYANAPILDDLYQLWHSDSDRPDGFNRMSFVNARADELIEEIRSTLDEEKRNALYVEIQQLIYDEQPVIFLVAPQSRITVHNRFKVEASIVSPGLFPTLMEQRQ
ncbi:MAG: ABC transporter substrate-binding protein [Bacteroidota bacterium]